MNLTQTLDKCSYTKAQMCKGMPLSRCGQGTIISLWHEDLWCEVAGGLGSCLCGICTKVQLPPSNLGPHPDLCPEPCLCVICSNWWPSSSATANNVSMLKLPEFISVLLTCYSWTITGTARRCILSAITFKWSCHCGAKVWCRYRATSNAFFIPSIFSS